MSDFSDSTTPILLDPYKRVRYTHGLVLGVPEFEQEQLYFLEKGQVHTRALHGYGTANGLKLGVKEGPEVTVAPGLAVNAIGQLIRVTRTQCANLNTWLGRSEVRSTLQGLEVNPVNSEGTGSVTVHVVLCYDECSVDPVTIPGAACRSQDDTVTPSRIVDSFRLNLSFTPPDQLEEDTVREFGALLRRIEVTDEGGPYSTEAELLDLVRALIPIEETDEETEEDGDGEEVEPAALRIHPDDACEIYCAMLRVWVTEVRAALNGLEGGTIPPTEGCVLLGTLDFNITNWTVSTPVADISIDESRRPILAHVRMLQEWIACGQSARRGEAVQTFATLTLLPDRNPFELLAWIHHPLQLTIPTEAVTIALEGQTVDPSRYVVEPLEDFNVFRIQFLNPVEEEDPYDNTEQPIEDDPTADSVLFLYDGALVTVRFNTEGITIGDLEGSLYDQMGSLHYNLDRDDKILTAYLVADLPSLEDMMDVEISGEVANGDALLYQDGIWQPGAVIHPGDIAAGDLDGTYPDPMVVALRTFPIVYPKDLTTLKPDEVLTLRAAEKGKWFWEPAMVSSLLGAGKEGDVLTYVQGQWVARPPSGGGGDAGGDLSGTYPDPKVVGIVGFPIKLGRAMPDGSILVFHTGANGDSQSGTWSLGIPSRDLSGTYPDPAVVGILGYSINTDQYGDKIPHGALIRFNAEMNQWELYTQPVASPTQTITAPFADIYWGSDGVSGTVRFHIQVGKFAADPMVQIDITNPGMTLVDDQTGKAISAKPGQAANNLLTFTLNSASRTARYARVVFDTRQVRLNNGKVLQDYCDARGIQFIGQDPASRTITLYTVIPAQAQVITG